MARKVLFDPKSFWPKWAKEQRCYRAIQVEFFSDKVVLMRFFTSKKERSSSLSFPSRARKRSLGFWERLAFSAKAAERPCAAHRNNDRD